MSVIVHFGFMGLFQVVSALPFLLQDFMAYVRIAFNFSRDFDHQTNMAWTFIGDASRHDTIFYKLLLGSTVVLLLCFLYVCDKVILSAKHVKSTHVAKWKLFMLAASQFVAFSFSRGLHVQFTLWIFFSLPFLLITLFDTINKPAISTYSIIALVYYLLDWCLSAPRSVLHVAALGHMLRHALAGNFGEAIKVWCIHVSLTFCSILNRLINHCLAK